ADRNRSHWSTSKTPSYTKSVSWQHHPTLRCVIDRFQNRQNAFPSLYLLHNFKNKEGVAANI
ncbi:hypothetical protein NP313_06845, partial [Salmonella enterica]|nr:hypothetical protein [Salmonella enterica]MCQ8132316.1 hypothetical protein [Salmonella enterica]MCQ8163926.1 hypothetical protein [Salmonella enterica]